MINPSSRLSLLAAPWSDVLLAKPSCNLDNSTKQSCQLDATEGSPDEGILCLLVELIAIKENLQTQDRYITSNILVQTNLPGSGLTLLVSPPCGSIENVLQWLVNQVPGHLDGDALRQRLFGHRGEDWSLVGKQRKRKRA